jgi:hypothetical protein
MTDFASFRSDRVPFAGCVLQLVGTDVVNNLLLAFTVLLILFSHLFKIAGQIIDTDLHLKR